MTANTLRLALAALLAAPAVHAALTAPGMLPQAPALKALDAQVMGKDDAARYTEAVRFEQGDSSPEDKAENWRQFGEDSPAYASFATARADAWRAYGAALLKAKKARLAARDADWAKLAPKFADASASSDELARLTAQFLGAYMEAGLEPAMARAMAPYASAGAMRGKLQALAALAPSIPTKIVDGKAGVKWVTIPGGSFVMGTEDSDLTTPKPAHEVKVKTFELAQAPITFGQYKACVKDGACTPAHVSDGQCYVWIGKGWLKGELPKSFQGDDQPVVCLDLAQAQAVAAWAGGRLPTEAEWEYAARAGGRDQKYPWGNEAPSCERAVMDDGSGLGCGRAATWPVCSKPKGNTAHGLCDMAGNVWQWTADNVHFDYNGAPADGSTWANPTNTDHVKRGGFWRSTGDDMRAAYRGYCDPRHIHDYNGVRPAR